MVQLFGCPLLTLPVFDELLRMLLILALLELSLTLEVLE